MYHVLRINDTRSVAMHRLVNKRMRYVRAGEPDLGVPLVLGVLAPDGPNEDGGPTSPAEPSGAKELMYALIVSFGVKQVISTAYLKKCLQEALEGVK